MALSDEHRAKLLGDTVGWIATTSCLLIGWCTASGGLSGLLEVRVLDLRTLLIVCGVMSLVATVGIGLIHRARMGLEDMPLPQSRLYLRLQVWTFAAGAALLVLPALATSKSKPPFAIRIITPDPAATQVELRAPPEIQPASILSTPIILPGSGVPANP